MHFVVTVCREPEPQIVLDISFGSGDNSPVTIFCSDWTYALTMLRRHLLEHDTLKVRHDQEDPQLHQYDDYREAAEDSLPPYEAQTCYNPNRPVYPVGHVELVENGAWVTSRIFVPTIDQDEDTQEE